MNLSKMLRGGGAALLLFAGVVGALYHWNQAPAPQPVASSEAAQPTRPYVVKLHAQWCPVCLATRDDTYRASIDAALAARSPALPAATAG